MKVWLTTLVFGLALLSCKQKEATSKSVINDAHLDHLYESYIIDGQKIGSVWIYCEAPDYQLLTDEDEGYTCVDDVARSLVFYAKQYSENPSSKIEAKIHELTRFILHMQAENGYFYNFIFPDKEINKTHVNSVAEPNWWTWRAFWALSEVVNLKGDHFDDIRIKANAAIDILLPLMFEMCSDLGEMTEKEGIKTPACIAKFGGDQIALMMIGLSTYYKLNPTEEVKDKLLEFGEILQSLQLGNAETFPFYASMSWQNIWHAWGNSQAYALLLAGKQLGNDAMIQAGKREVEYFIPYFLKEHPSFLIIGKIDGDYSILETDRFPQIAYNLRPMIYATLEVYAIEKDKKFRDQALALAKWFSGQNQAQKQMYNPAKGLTFDGIVSEEEVNMNSGAESTIEALLSLQALSRYPEIWELVENEFSK